MKKLLVIFFLFLAPHAHAAVAWVASSQGNAATPTTITYSAPTLGSSNFCATSVMWIDIGTTKTLNTVTLNGVAETQLLNDKTTVGNRGEAFFYIKAPTAGNVVVTWSGGITNFGQSNTECYSGVDQTNPIDVSMSGLTDNAGATSQTLTLTTVINNDWLVGAWYVRDNGTDTDGTNTKIRQQVLDGDGGKLVTADSNGARATGSNAAQVAFAASVGSSAYMTSIRPAATAAAFNFWQFLDFF